MRILAGWLAAIAINAVGLAGCSGMTTPTSPSAAAGMVPSMALTAESGMEAPTSTTSKVILNEKIPIFAGPVLSCEDDAVTFTSGTVHIVQSDSRTQVNVHGEGVGVFGNRYTINVTFHDAVQAQGEIMTFYSKTILIGQGNAKNTTVVFRLRIKNGEVVVDSFETSCRG